MGTGLGDGLIVWAVDPFLAEPKHTKAVASSIELLKSPDAKCSVQPVSVLSASDLNWPMALLAPLRRAPAAIVRKALYIQLDKVCKGIEAPEVLLQDRAARGEAVKKIVTFAKSQKASLIAVGTSGATALKSMRMGSFSETLIAVSKVPVLAVSPKAKIPRKISVILFPTDFSKSSRKVFKEVLRLARKHSARVVLMHVFDTSYQALAYGGEWGLGLDPNLVDQSFRDAEKARTRLGEEWQASAKRAKVDCVFRMSKGPFGTGAAILTQAKAVNADLIALATYRGRIEQAILGSVARDVLAGSTRPVIIVHTQRP